MIGFIYHNDRNNGIDERKSALYNCRQVNYENKQNIAIQI